jgi:diguanylate cyclase (GGDEF)-like protein
VEQVAADAHPPVAHNQPSGPAVGGAQYALTDDLLAGRFFSIDVRGQVTGWNPRAEAAFGWATHHVSGVSLFDKLLSSGMGFGPTDLEEFFTAATGGAGRRVRVLVSHQGGSQLPVELSIVPIQLAKAYELNAFLQDVSTSTASGVASEIGRVREEHADVLQMIASSLDQASGAAPDGEVRLAGALVVFHIDANAMTSAPPPGASAEAPAAAPPAAPAPAEDPDVARAEAERVRAQIDEAVAAAEEARSEAEAARRERDDLQARLDADASSAGGEVEAAQRAVEAARAEAEELRTRAAEVEASADESRTAAEEARRDAERLRGELDGLRSAADGSQASAEANAAELGQARAELSQAQSDAERLGEQLTRAESELTAAREERDGLRTEIEELRSQVEAAGQAHAELDQARTQVDALEADLAAARAEVEAAAQRAEEIAADAAAAREGGEAAEAAVSAAREEAHTAQAELAEAQERATALEGELETARADAVAAREETATAQGHAETSRAELEAAREEAGAAQTAATEATARAEQAEGELETARTELAAATERADAAGTELESARADLESARADLESARTELKTAQDELESSRAELTTAQDELQAAQAEVAAVRAELEAVQAQAESAGKTVGDAQAELGEARSEAVKARAEADKAAAEAEKATAAAEQAQADAEAARAEAEQARADAEAASAEPTTDPVFESIFEGAAIGMAIKEDGRFVRVNRALCELTGRDAADLLKVDPVELVHPDEREAHAATEKSLLSGEAASSNAEARMLHATGDEVPVRENASVLEDGKLLLQFELTEADAHTAVEDHDPVTGLFNRRRFEEELSRHVSEAAKNGDRGAALMLDLDANTSELDEAQGEELLKTVAEALKQNIDESEMLAHLGGDEFAVLLPHADAAHARKIAANIVEAVGPQVVKIGDQSVRVTIDVGVALFDERDESADDQPAAAAPAAEAAPEAPAGENLPAPVEPAAKSTALAPAEGIVNRIRKALAEDSFSLYAQPIIDLRTSEITQYELLLRMHDDSGRLMLPDKFLPAAQDAGLMPAIDQWVVRHAIALIHEAAQDGRRLLLEVNISSDSIDDEALTEVIEAELDATGIDPRMLVIEVTEDAALAKIQDTIKLSKWIRSVGCRFALDDFGSTFATVKYLKDMSVDYFKLDGDLIVTLPESRTNQLLLNALMDVARGTGTQTIAVYVPDDETLVMLRQYGIGYGQGNRVGRPRPVAEI